MNEKQITYLLQQKKLKRTRLRIALLHQFIQAKCALSYTDLKKGLGIADKSTIYRNLHTFEIAELIHEVRDDSGMKKYAFGASLNIGQNHPHFVCESCQAVYCIEDHPLTSFNMPDGFQPKKVNTIIKGICADC